MKKDRQQRGAQAKRTESAAEATLIWGIHPVGEILRRRPEQVLAVFIAPERNDAKSRAIAELAAHHRIMVEREIPANSDDAAAHQGVAALVKPPVLLTLKQLLARVAGEPAESAGGGSAPPLLLMLDSLQDPHNLGAVIRSAAAFGVGGVIIPKDRSAPLSGTVMKAAAGTLPLVEICQTTNLAAALLQLKQQGFWIYGAAGDAPATLYQTDFSGPVCLVVGNEEKGIRPLVRRHCDLLLSIPLAAGVESLNVSVATGIMLAEIRRRRQPT